MWDYYRSKKNALNKLNIQDHSLPVHVHIFLNCARIVEKSSKMHPENPQSKSHHGNDEYVPDESHGQDEAERDRNQELGQPEFSIRSWFL